MTEKPPDEPFSWKPFIEEWKRQWVERGESLAPWQEWYLKHIHCGGTFKMVYGRKGPKMICTCKGGDNVSTTPTPRGSTG